MAELLNGEKGKAAEVPQAPVQPEQPETALVPREEERAVALPLSMQTMIEVAKDRHRVLRKLREYAIRMTEPKHWTIQNDCPWLNSQGTDHVERIFGIASRVKHREKVWSEDAAGEKYYLWTVTVEVSLPSSPDVCEAMGSCSSRDKFLGELEATERRSARTQADVEPNVIKKAVTDAKRTAIHHLLELRGLSWEDLESAGIKKSEVAQVSYRSGGGRRK